MAIIIVVDTETTGLDPVSAAIVELGAVVMVEDHEVDQFTSLCNPGEEYLGLDADGALEVNNITRDQIRTAPAIEKVAEEFRKWLEPWIEAGALLTAFNVPFDRGFLVVEPWKIPSEWWSTIDIMLKAMDTMREGRALKRRMNGSEKWPSLKEAAKFFRVIPEGDPHRALTDVRTEATILSLINSQKP